MGGENPFGKGVIEIISWLETAAETGQGFQPARRAATRKSPSLMKPPMAFLTGKAISDRLQSMAPEGTRLQIPPACLVDMLGEPLEYEEGLSLSMRFPVVPRYANPLEHMQGGYIVAALDNTLGPFSYPIAPPSVTSSLDTQYLRPVIAEARFITCVARLAERARDAPPDR